MNIIPAVCCLNCRAECGAVADEDRVWLYDPISDGDDDITFIRHVCPGFFGRARAAGRAAQALSRSRSGSTDGGSSERG